MLSEIIELRHMPDEGARKALAAIHEIGEASVVYPVARPEQATGSADRFYFYEHACALLITRCENPAPFDLKICGWRARVQAAGDPQLSCRV